MQEIQSLEETYMDVFSVEAQYRNGKSQANILFEYLKTIIVHGDEAALAGFAAALTDAFAFPATDS